MDKIWRGGEVEKLASAFIAGLPCIALARCNVTLFLLSQYPETVRLEYNMRGGGGG